MRRYKNESIMIIGDTHLPYIHPDSMEFYGWVKEQVNPERIFHTGDLCDNYGFSRYVKTPEADSIPQELASIKKSVKDLGSLFPTLTIVSSNHDDRLYSKGSLAGIPRHLIKPYEEVIGADVLDWKWVDDYTLTLSSRECMHLCHTRPGQTLNLAKMYGMNVVVGHHHTKQAIQYFVSPVGRIWAMDVGCMIDNNHYAFAYNRVTLGKPALGCAAVINGEPILFPMRLTKGGKWKRPKKEI